MEPERAPGHSDERTALREESGLEAGPGGAGGEGRTRASQPSLAAAQPPVGKGHTHPSSTSSVNPASDKRTLQISQSFTHNVQRSGKQRLTP